MFFFFFFFSSRRRHTRLQGDWSSDVCSSDLEAARTARLPIPTAAPSGSAWGVEALLCVEQPDLEERLDGVGSLVEQEGQNVGALGLREVLEHEVGRVLAT